MKNATLAFASLALAFMLFVLVQMRPAPEITEIATEKIEADTQDMVIVYSGYDYVAASLDGDICVGRLHSEEPCARAIPAPSIP
jgi:hypothetical protein